MFFDFKFWRFLTEPQQLASRLQTSEMRGFNIRVAVVLLIGILLFSFRELWGMGTESITPLLTTLTTANYTIARFASLGGTILWAIVYMAFHFFGFAYILSLLTAIPFKKLLPLQLLMTGLLLIEKALVTIVFMVKGATASVSFLSFGPLAATFLDSSYLILFLNQLTLTTALIVTYQYRFTRSYSEISNRRGLFWMIFGIHIGMALFVAGVSYIPFESLFHSLVERGVGHE